jgi:transporter family-2 protein
MLSAVLVAVLTGVAIATQASVLGSAGRRINPLSVSLALQLSGVLVGLLWLAWSRSWGEVVDVARAWWWIPLGLLGLVVVAAIGYSGARLGALATLALLVAAQLVTGLLLDLRTGSVMLDWRQPLGILLVLGGTVLISARS